MRFLLAILMGILITGSPAAGAEGDIVEVLQTGIRHDLNWNLFLTVTGKTKSGQIVYAEKEMTHRRITVFQSDNYHIEYKRYDIYNYYIIYEGNKHLYILGEVQEIDYAEPPNESVSNARLNIPWKFRTDTQDFELDFKISELTPFDYGDGRLNAATVSETEGTDELKAKALQGDEEAIATLKNRGVWD